VSFAIGLTLGFVLGMIGMAAAFIAGLGLVKRTQKNP
jgi:hypothetical protein